MARIEKEQLDNASGFMAAFWKELVKPFYNSEDSDEYWLKLINKENDLFDRFDLGHNPQLLEMMFGFVCGLEIKAGSKRLSYLEKIYRKFSGKEKL